MRELSAIAKAEKNRLCTNSAWLWLLEIRLKNGTVYRLVRNNEDIAWSGETWQAFSFEVPEVDDDDSGAVPEVTLRVSNVSRQLEKPLQDGGGGVDSTAILMLVNSNYLDGSIAEWESIWEVEHTETNADWVTFTLSADNPWDKRFPLRRIQRGFCSCRKFKDDDCGYTGSETECNFTLARCRELGNSARFGGCPGVGRGGVVQ